MFRSSMLAIFRLYMRNLSIIYTKVCGESTVCDGIHMYHLACSWYLTTQQGLQTSKKKYAVYVRITQLFVFVALQLTVVVFSQPGSGLYPPRFRDFLITHNDVPQSVRLLWTSDQSVAEASICKHITLTTDKHP